MLKEKTIEKRLVDVVSRVGGLCLKLPAAQYVGIPDRLVLLPGGILAFVELKRAGQKPRYIQKRWHSILTQLGFNVFVIDFLIDDLTIFYSNPSADQTH